MEKISMVLWKELANSAWETRKNAYLIGETAVGAALLSDKNEIFTGCNVEHRYRINDIHAEVNAITNMVSAGSQRIRGIIVVSERNRFTPCGACLEWIFQFGGPDCEVAYQSGKDGEITIFVAKDLMPYYPVL